MSKPDESLYRVQREQDAVHLLFAMEEKGWLSSQDAKEVLALSRTATVLVVPGQPHVLLSGRSLDLHG